MIPILKSRHLQICVLLASLLFVLWLSASMWVSALQQRQSAYDFREVNDQEEVLFQFSNVLAAERLLMYTLFSRESVDIEGVEQLKELFASTEEFIRENYSTFSAIGTAAHLDFETNVVHDHSGHGMGQQAAHPNVGGVIPAHSTEKESQHKSGANDSKDDLSVGARTSAENVLLPLRKNEVKLLEQLLKPRNVRESMYGMIQFHQYTLAIEIIDEMRHELHTKSTQSLSEHYIVTKLKDAFWEFQESSAQTTSLLEGIASMSEASDEMTQLTHHADMLMELNVRVDFAWNSLYKTIIASDNNEMLDNANSIALWYNENFRGMIFEMMASTRQNNLTKDDLQRWLIAAHRLSSLSEDVRTQARNVTGTLIDQVVRRSNLNLIQVSVLVFFSLFMTIASVLFFRRADRQAHQDELTCLDNRRMFSLATAKCLSTAETETGILMIDLDRFKHINDTMGHAAGDALLKDVSMRISKAGADCVSVSRLGGDEFAMLFNDRNVDKMKDVAADIRQRLIDPFHVGGATLKIGSSIGLAKAPRDADTPDTLIQAADLAMYCAKKSGTNQISTYDSEVDQSMMMAARTVTELQLALLNNEFELFYQPQFNIAQARVLSAEALIRWNHPERGFLTPNHFISIAEENGLMPAIGSWVIEEACRQAADWLYNKNMPLRVAINISADHFFQSDFVQLIVCALEKHKLPPQLLEVEVTESVAMSDINLVVKSLQQLRDLSIHVALDDFGTGYSSLSYLQELPLDTLKIDKSFIQNMLQGNAQKESITETIVALGNRLNLETVAEGVETLDQLAAVSDMQISVVQGFYYSRPVSASELEFVVKQLNEDDNDNDQKAA